MRMFAFVALLFPALAAGQDIVRQGWGAGNLTLGGCTNMVAADTNTLTVGNCFPLTASNESIWVNDCWSNGVASLTHYNGSTSCDAAFASGYVVAPSVYTNQSFCNVDTNPVAYNTFTCSSATPPSNTIIMINAYYLQSTCSGTPVPFNATVGACTQLIQGFYALGNCANGLVTASLYSDPACNVVFNSTNQITSLLATVGPTAQLGAASAQGKQEGQPGSTCAVVPGKAALSFTCYTPTTPTPSNPGSSSSSSTGGNTGAPTTPAPGSSGNQGGSASHITFGVAALVVPLLAALL